MGKPHGRRRTPGLRLQQRLTPPITTKQPAGPEKPNRNLGASVPSVSVRGSPWAQCPERPHGNLGVRRFISAFQSRVRTSPLASELPLTCQALPFAGGPSGPYLSACGGQLLNVRCAHYAGGASLTTFGFVTIVPRYLLPQVMPSHSFAALTALVVRRVKGHLALLIHRVNSFEDQPMLACTSRRTPPGGALACALGSGTLPPRR